MSNLLHTDVLFRKTASNTSPDEEEQGMYIPNILIAGALYAGTAAGLKRPFSIELNESHADNEGPIRRFRTVANGELTSKIPGHPHIFTVYDLVKNAVDVWKDKNCLGSRRVVQKHGEEKQITKIVNGAEQQTLKTWVYLELSPYEYRTYRDLGAEANSIGSGLRKLGLNPSDPVGLYADTSYLPFKRIC